MEIIIILFMTVLGVLVSGFLEELVRRGYTIVPMILISSLFGSLIYFMLEAVKVG